MKHDGDDRAIGVPERATRLADPYLKRYIIIGQVKNYLLSNTTLWRCLSPTNSSSNIPEIGSRSYSVAENQNQPKGDLFFFFHLLFAFSLVFFCLFLPFNCHSRLLEFKTVVCGCGSFHVAEWDWFTVLREWTIKELYITIYG
jgi:hypothetical protein